MTIVLKYPEIVEGFCTACSQITHYGVKLSMSQPWWSCIHIALCLSQWRWRRQRSSNATVRPQNPYWCWNWDGVAQWRSSAHTPGRLCGVALPIHLDDSVAWLCPYTWTTLWRGSAHTHGWLCGVALPIHTDDSVVWLCPYTRMTMVWLRSLNTPQRDEQSLGCSRLYLLLFLIPLESRPFMSKCVPWWNLDCARALRVKSAAWCSFCRKRNIPGHLKFYIFQKICCF